MTRLEKIVFGVFLFCIPFQLRRILFEFTLPFNEWTSAFLWFSDLLVIALLILWIGNERGRLGRFQILPLLLLLVALISIKFALIPGVSWYRWIKLSEYIFVFFYFTQRVAKFYNRESIYEIVLFSAFFQALIGIFQFLFQKSLGLKILGESVLNLSMNGIAVVVADGERFLRAYGTFPHPNLLALWLVVGIWAYWSISKKSLRYDLPYALVLIALVLTFSRTVIFFWVISSLFLIKKSNIRLATTTLVVLLVASLAVLPQITSRLKIASDSEEVSNRIFYNKIALNDSKEHFLAGSGIGQFTPMLMSELKFYPRYIYQPVHNLYLLILSEIGFLGLVIFVAILSRLSWKVRTNSLKLAMLFVLAGVGLFDHYLWTLQQGGLMLWGLIGLIDT